VFEIKVLKSTACESMWRNTVWLKGEGRYTHQRREADGSLTNCPTIQNALPRRMDDFMEWFNWATIERVRLLAERADKRRLEKIGKDVGRSYTTWVERSPEGPARLLNSGKPYPDSKPYTWRTTGTWLTHSMKGAKSEGAVRFNGEITIGIAALRKYGKAVGHDVIDLTLEPATGGNPPALYIATVPEPGAKLRSHRTTFKAGAFDKYQGANGYTCAVTFSDTVQVPLDDRKCRPGRYNPFTLEPMARRKAKPITVDLAVVVDNEKEMLPWVGYECNTLGLCVVQEPERDEVLKRDGTLAWMPVKGHWQVIHIGSGMPVRMYRLSTKKAALQVADALGTMADWTKSESEICTVSNDVRRARSQELDRVYSRAGATGVY